MSVFLRSTLLALCLALAAGACGDDDDGASVRDDSGSESASGSEADHESDEEHASGSATGSGPATCQPQGDATAADVTVEVTMGEFFYTLDQTSIPAGTIHFEGDNTGSLAHEFVIAKGTEADLPLNDDGLPDEAALGDGLIGEVPAFPSQSTCDGTWELEAGDYVMFCIITEPNGTNHYTEGMVTSFTVT